jgi:hypothetical protein
VRQENATHPGERLGLVLSQPGQLGDGERRYGHAAARGGPRARTQPVYQYGRLRRRLGVVPELGRAQHAVARVQHHHSVLLARDSHRVGSRRARLRVRSLERRRPGSRVLLRAGRRHWRVQRASARDQTPVVGVANLHLGGLRRRVDS